MGTKTHHVDNLKKKRNKIRENKISLNKPSFLDEKKKNIIIDKKENQEHE